MSARDEIPVTGTCSKCKASVSFQMDPYEKQLMSDCCWAPEWNPTEEP